MGLAQIDQGFQDNLSSITKARLQDLIGVMGGKMVESDSIEIPLDILKNSYIKSAKNYFELERI